MALMVMPVLTGEGHLVVVVAQVGAYTSRPTMWLAVEPSQPTEDLVAIVAMLQVVEELVVGSQPITLIAPIQG